MDTVKDKILFQWDIIEELGKIYSLYNECVIAEDNYEKALDDAFVSGGDILKNSFIASFISVGGFQLGEYLSGNDASMLYYYFTILSASVLGSLALNRVCESEFSSEEKEILKLVLQRVELHKIMFLGMIKKYVENYDFEVGDFDFKKELFELFSTNIDYIISGIKDGVFDSDFDFENVCEALDYLIGDEDIYDFLENGKVNKMRIR